MQSADDFIHLLCSYGPVNLDRRERMKVRTRFAPSPTGYLHVGGARTALYSWLYARKNKGDFIVRVEDTDQARSTKESEEMLLADLKWLGLDWDEGPGKEKHLGPYHQSQRLSIYEEHIERLLKESKAYYCFCTEEELEKQKELAKAAGKPPHYDGTHRELSIEDAKQRIAKGEKAVVRFKTPQQKTDYIIQDIVRGEVSFPSDMIGDFIIQRSDGMPVYNFCCAIDDALMEMTHVLRAEEHLSNTLRQAMIYEAFNYPMPQFGHLSLILGQDRQKLSKRHGATSCKQYMDMGYLPEALNNFLALLGWSSPKGDEILSLEVLLEQFDIDRFTPSAAVFDEEKLNWMNATHLRALPHQELWQRIQKFLRDEGIDPEANSFWQQTEWQNKSLELFKTNMVTLKDAVELYRPLDDRKFSIAEASSECLSWDTTKNVIQTWLQAISEESEDFISQEDFLNIQNQVKEKCGVKGKQLFMPIRVAVVGYPQGAELKNLVPLLPKLSLISRAEKVLNTL